MQIIKNIFLKKYFYVFLFISVIFMNIEYFEIDNEFILYEKNNDYSNFSTNIKTIALYLPQFHSISENDKWWGKGFTEWDNVKKDKPLYKGHYQPRKPGDKLGYLGYYELTNVEVIKKQVKLAKCHGIYGFGIYYYWFSGKRLLEKPLDIFLNNKDIKFNFLLIWANENWTRRWDGLNSKILIKQEYNENDPINFIRDIKKYLIDDRYIKLNEKPIIGIYEPLKIPNLNETIFIWRRESKKVGIGEIYILVALNSYNYKEFENIKIFNGVYEFPPRDSFIYKIKNRPFLLYTAILYKNYELINVTDEFPIYRGSMLGFDNSPRRKKPAIFENYSPEQFYIINKKIIEWTKMHYNITNKFIFINAWNEWGEGTYLEPDSKYGYASINSLSKALFNKPYIEINFNSSLFNKQSFLAILAHMISENLIIKIIEKTNNIPIKFDLFISTNSLKKRDIENYISKYSKANFFEIKIIDKKKTKILYILNQMKKIIKNYKYFIFIDVTKENFHEIDNENKKYLLENLLGNKFIISEILSDFENNDKLGFIFPENYYMILLRYGVKLKKTKNIKFLLKNIFSKIKIRKKLELTVGNMFWAKIKSIFQIFELNFKKKIYQRLNYKYGDFVDEIEMICLYLVKINGYFYKKIFKYI